MVIVHPGTPMRQCCRWLPGEGRALQLVEPSNGLVAAGSAHLLGRLQSRTECRTFRLSENETPVVSPKLNASHPRRFSVRHSRNGAGNRGGGAAGTTVVAAIHAGQGCRRTAQYNARAAAPPAPTGGAAALSILPRLYTINYWSFPMASSPKPRSAPWPAATRPWNS